MPVYALESGAELVIINQEPTPMDRYAHICIRERAGEVTPRILNKVKEEG